MTTFESISMSQVAGNTQTRLMALRSALEGVTELYGWFSEIALTDLEALGFNANDAQSMMSAVNDANALAQIYSTGLPPGTYPQPPEAYVYAASQRIIIGPQ
jgi:hypothetical protein